MITKKINKLSYSKLTFLGIIILLAFFIPFLLLGEGAHLIVLDNMDNAIVDYKILDLNNRLLDIFNNSILPNPMLGLEAYLIRSNINFQKIFFHFLPFYWAYVANSFTVRIVGLIGILLLHKDYFKNSSKIFALLIAISFSVLSTYTNYGISIMGLPIVLWAFLNFSSRKKIFLSIVLILFYCGYSSFFLVGIFILFLLISWGGYEFICLRKKLNFYYWMGISVFILGVLVFNHAYFIGHFTREIPSHRTEMFFHNLGWLYVVKATFNSAIFGQFHAASINAIPVGILILYAGFVNKKHKYFKRALIVLILIFTFSFQFAIFSFVIPIFQEGFPLIKTFNFFRFILLNPFLYFIILLFLIQNKKLKKSFILIGILSFTFFNFLNNKEFSNNWKTLFSSEVTFKKGEKHYFQTVPFEEYYSKNLFKQINDYIGKPQQDYRVISIGLVPGIAIFNGFYSLDYYTYDYPLTYKKQFRQIIELELEKNSSLKAGFDKWGNRCYTFVNELFDNCYLDCDKTQNISIKNLQLNWEQLKSMGGEYIFSAVPIENNEDLKFERLFEGNTARYKIYLYKVL